MLVLTALQSVPIEDVEGADILQNFLITSKDFFKDRNDLCGEGADAYTSNGVRNGDEVALTYFCDAAYGSEENEQAPTLSDIECDDFLLTDLEGNKRYRVTNEMEPIAATMLHEIMHFNAIGRAAGQTEVSVLLFIYHIFSFKVADCVNLRHLSRNWYLCIR